MTPREGVRWLPRLGTSPNLVTRYIVTKDGDAMQERLRALLDAAQQKAGSDYKVAQLLGVPRQNVSDWRNGRRTCTPEDQALLAAIAGMDPEETLVRAVLEKHANTPKGEKLLSALGNASRRIGEVVTSVFFGSVGWALAGALLPNKAEAAQIAAGAMARAGTGSVTADLLVAIATMCRKVKSMTHSGSISMHQVGVTGNAGAA